MPYRKTVKAWEEVDKTECNHYKVYKDPLSNICVAREDISFIKFEKKEVMTGIVEPDKVYGVCGRSITMDVEGAARGQIIFRELGDTFGKIIDDNPWLRDERNYDKLR